MATLIQQVSSGGSRRRCDARCYNAQHSKCTCICGGMNHGKGLQKALENTKQVAEKLLEMHEHELQGQGEQIIAREILAEIEAHRKVAQLP